MGENSIENWEDVPDPDFDRRQNADYVTGDALQLLDAEPTESLDIGRYTELESNVPSSSKRAKHLPERMDGAVHRDTWTALHSRQTGHLCQPSSFQAPDTDRLICRLRS